MVHGQAGCQLATLALGGVLVVQEQVAVGVFGDQHAELLLGGQAVAASRNDHLIGIWVHAGENADLVPAGVGGDDLRGPGVSYRKLPYVDSLCPW